MSMPKLMCRLTRRRLSPCVVALTVFVCPLVAQSEVQLQPEELAYEFLLEQLSQRPTETIGEYQIRRHAFLMGTGLSKPEADSLGRLSQSVRRDLEALKSELLDIRRRKRRGEVVPSAESRAENIRRERPRTLRSFMIAVKQTLSAKSYDQLRRKLSLE